MSELRVPKRKVSVELKLRGGASRKAELFLAEFASEHVGAERLSDLLNGKSDFIPAFVGSGMVLLNRHSVMVAQVAAELEVDEAEQHTLPTEVEVKLTLEDGSQLEGILTYVRPPDRSRPVDYLNDGEPFLKLHQKDKVALVHKRSVAEVALV